MSPHHASRAWVAGLLVLAGLGGSGCSVLSPAPTLELVKAAGTAASLAVARHGPLTASSSVYHSPADWPVLCIEFNPSVAVPDLVNALQAELRRHAVPTRVLESQAPAHLCAHWLRYQATVAWDLRPVERRLDMYIDHLSLTVQDSQGRVLSHSALDSVDGWFVARWASTRAKVVPVVKALLDGGQG